jgi:hypothetical protein
MVFIVKFSYVHIVRTNREHHVVASLSSVKLYQNQYYDGNRELD